MSKLDFLKFDFLKGLNIRFLIKGLVLGLILMIPTLIGVAMRVNQVQGFMTFFFITFLSVIVIIGIYDQLRQEFKKASKEKEVKEPTMRQKREQKKMDKLEKEKEARFATESDKKSGEKLSAETESPENDEEAEDSEK